ncbi:MAG TPA: glycosyltransferase family 4 protein [Thermoanaerobaculia bacterium]|jgi:glycosyltransferase involved in cell wall biosynthesis|nr:glycosyltransferase family 4 protein [Thermoanaerobaculia bacterium]
MKILLVTSRYPWPPRRGDQMRALQMLDLLAEEHDVTLLAPAPRDSHAPPPEGTLYRVELYQLGGGSAFLSGLARSVLTNQPLQAGLFYHPDLGSRIRELAPQHELGILQLVRLALHVEDFGATSIVVDLIDSLALNFSRRAEVDRWWLVPLLELEARRLATAERRLAERAERLLVVCERDRQALVNRLPPHLESKIAVVRLAVSERPLEPPLDREKLWREGDVGPVLAMTGNLGYFVNADAVAWWLRDVWPRLRRLRPDARLVVAGDRPSRALRRAVEKAGARLIESPRDLRTVLAQATLSLAPLRCGSGVPVKVLEAWSVGVPVLASSWAVAGTSGRQGEDFILVGDDPVEWIAAITDLLDNPSARHWLIENGRRRLAADYSREAVRRQLLEAIGVKSARRDVPRPDTTSYAGHGDGGASPAAV